MRVIKLARSLCYIVQSCKQDLNTYRAKQDNDCVRACRVRAFTLFPEIPWRITIYLLHQTAREIVLLLVNNVHEKTSQKVKTHGSFKAYVRYL